MTSLAHDAGRLMRHGRQPRTAAERRSDTAWLLSFAVQVPRDLKALVRRVSPVFKEVDGTGLTRSAWMLSRASDDIHEPEHVQGLLKDLREARQAKSRQGLEALNAVHIEVCLPSVHQLRPHLGSLRVCVCA